MIPSDSKACRNDDLASVAAITHVDEGYIGSGDLQIPSSSNNYLQYGSILRTEDGVNHNSDESKKSSVLQSIDFRTPDKGTENAFRQASG